MKTTTQTVSEIIQAETQRCIEAARAQETVTYADLVLVLDDTTVTYEGVDLLDYAALYLAISQYLDGNLPDGYTLEWGTSVSEARARRVLSDWHEASPETWTLAESGRWTGERSYEMTEADIESIADAVMRTVGRAPTREEWAAARS